MKAEDQTQDKSKAPEAEDVSQEPATEKAVTAGEHGLACDESKTEDSSERQQAVNEESPEKSVETGAQKIEQQEAESSARARNKSTEVSGMELSVAGNEIVQKAETAVVAHTLNINQIIEATRSQKEEKSIFDFLTEFDSRTLYLPDFVPDDLQDYVDRLKQDRIIVISCGDIEIALDVADRILHSVNGNHPLNASLIDLENKNLEGISVSIDSFSNKEIETEAVTAILVKVLSEKGREFLGSLFGDTSLSARIKKALNDNKLFLICIAEREDIQNRPKVHSKKLHFCHWNVGFLQPLLKHHIPEEYDRLERQILAQRAQGKWSKIESDFCNELLNALSEGKERFKKEVEERDGSGDATHLESLFKSNEPITATALYVATFFPNLTPGEFRNVVKALLDGHKTRAPIPALPKTDEGQSQENNMIAPSEVWENEADSYLEKCHLEVLSTREASKTIGISNYALRENFKQYLEKKHPLYLAKQFESIQKQGILFNQSPRVAESAGRVVVEMARGCPEDYGSDWIVGIVRKLRRQFDLCVEEGKPSYPIFDCLKDFHGNRLARGYTRISQWLRGMLEDSKLEHVVSESLNRLMVPDVDGSVLEIVRRIRFAPNFDDLYWVKQLFDRGGKEMRDQTFGYLYTYVKSSEMRIYEVLLRMNEWGIKDRKEKNPQSSISALRLLMNYCIDTIANFDPERRGLWPSKYPLFTAADAVAARENLALLTSWLFHPGMKEALKQIGLDEGIDLDEDINPLIAFLISEWIFILCDKSEQGASEPPARTQAELSNDSNEVGAESAISPAIMRNILLEQAASRASGVQQKEFLEYWGLQRREKLMARPQTRKEKEEIQSRCRLLNDLIRDFKDVTKRCDSPKH